jgi:hypothetical protein
MLIYLSGVDKGMTGAGQALTNLEETIEDCPAGACIHMMTYGPQVSEELRRIVRRAHLGFDGLELSAWKRRSGVDGQGSLR